MKKFLLFAFYCFFLLYYSLAQQVYSYGPEKLSCSQMTAMTQDVNGFVWIATENGLDKFDGWSFTRYFNINNDSTSLAGNFVQDFLTDKKGKLWISSSKGLQYYSEYLDSFVSVTFPDVLNPSVVSVLELHNGEIWATTAGYGVFSICPETMEAEPIVAVNALCESNYMNYLYEDNKKNIWIGLPNGSVACIDSDLKNIVIHKLPSSRGRIYDMLEDDNNRILIANSSSVCVLDEENTQFTILENQKEESLIIRGMIKTSNGDILVNTLGQGVKTIDFEKKQLKAYIHKGIPKSDHIWKMMEDKHHNLWFGCLKNGLVMLSNESAQFDFLPLSDISPREPSTGNTVSSIYEDKEGVVWVSTGGGIITSLDENGVVTSSYSIGKDVISMLEDKSGVFWLGSYYSNFAQFDKKTGSVKVLPFFKGKPIKKIIEGKDDALYVSVMGEGFARYDLLTKTWRMISDTTWLNTTMRLANNWIHDILCDSEGLIWLGHTRGINCYDPEKNVFLKIDSASELMSNLCYSLLEDKEKNIWIGTNNGLFKLNKETNQLKHYNTVNGMPSNMICGLGIGENGDIWCSTYNGICRLKYPDREIVNYFSGGGLQDKEYIESVFCQSENGKIYFGGINGVTMFMPDSITIKKSLSAPVLTHIYLNNKEVSGGLKNGKKRLTDDVFNRTKQINLTYKQSIIELDFSTMDFHNKENIYYEYRLVELGKTWQKTVPGDNRITYNYLPYGKYTLEVLACENDFKSPIRTFVLTNTPPWYKTIWANVFYILLLVIVILFILYYLYLRQQRFRKEEINEEKMKFFINIAHELRSPITLILSPLARLIQIEKEQKKKKSLELIYRNANRILNLVNQLLDIQKIDKGQMKIGCKETDLVGFIKELTQLFEYQSKERNIEFNFETKIDKLLVWIDRNNFDKVLMNLLVNAFKYTPDEGEITVILDTGHDSSVCGPLSDFAEIKIIDSGIGLGTNKAEYIFDRFYQVSSSSQGFGIGLNLTKMLVEMHYGTIKAANRENNNGSIFTISVPLGKNHLRTEELVEDEILIKQVDLGHLSRMKKPYIEPKASLDEVKSKNNYKVLVVDDDDELRKYLKQELCSFYKVFTACNGTEAYRLILEQKVDLIVSDVVMPEMDGYELLSKIRENTFISHIPFILLTTQVEYTNRIKGWGVGADAFLGKPFQVEELLMICDNLIKGRIHLRGKFGMGDMVKDMIEPIKVKSNDEIFMERLMEIINKNLEDSSFRVQDLADAVGVSRVQLHRKLKTLTGSTPSDFIRNIRLKQAAKLLREKELNVSQIAYLVGFTSPSLLSTGFKKMYGCTPTEYVEREMKDCE